MSKSIALKISVLMADHLEVIKGAKIDFHYEEEKQLFIASSEKLSFGIAKTMIEGNAEDLQSLGKDFSGIVVKNDPVTRIMIVKIKKGKV